MLTFIFDAISLLVLASVVLSWVDTQRQWAISRILGDLVDPLLMPIRKVLPPAGGLDFSPLVLLVLLNLVRGLLG